MRGRLWVWLSMELNTVTRMNMEESLLGLQLGTIYTYENEQAKTDRTLSRVSSLPTSGFGISLPPWLCEPIPFSLSLSPFFSLSLSHTHTHTHTNTKAHACLHPFWLCFSGEGSLTQASTVRMSRRQGAKACIGRNTYTVIDELLGAQ